MILYIIRRILLFIPSLIAISLLAFIINIEAPGDPVERLVNASVNEAGNMKLNRQEIIAQKRKELGLDLPIFYFSVSPLSKSVSSPGSWQKYVPAIHFYGTKNQYHRWVSNVVLQNDWGISYNTQLPVIQQIRPRFTWTLILTIVATIMAFGISIPIGLYAAQQKGRFFDKLSTVGIFMLYSLPNFFIASLLLVFFANPQFLSWFPESGVQDVVNFNDNWPIWVKIVHWAPYLVLPLLVYCYTAVAFVTRQMRASAAEVFDQDYIITARAKGLPEGKVLWKHVLRNAIAPIITTFSNSFTIVVTGSVVVETIFSIPGMGREIYMAVLNSDYPIIVAVFTIIAFLTLTGYLVADILYAVADPRISYSKK